MKAVQIAIISLVLFGAILSWARFADPWIIANWRAVARRLGLRFEGHVLGGEPGIHGEMHGVKLGVMVRTRPVPPGGGCGILQDHLCVGGEVARNFPCELVIQRPMYCDLWSRVFLGPVVKSGDADLDARFVFRGVSRTLIVQLVRHPAVKRVLLRRARWVHSVVVRGNTVRAERYGLMFSEASLQGTIEMCAEVAQALQTAADSLRSQRALTAPDSGLWQPPADVDAPRVEGERRAEARPDEDEKQDWW